MQRPGDEPDRVSEREGTRPDIGALFREGVPIDRALGRAVREALRLHKKLGNPIAVWKDGQVVWIPPERIPVDG